MRHAFALERQRRHRREVAFLLVFPVVIYSLFVFCGFAEEFVLTATVVSSLVCCLALKIAVTRCELPLGLDVGFRDGSKIVECACVLRITDERVDLFASTLFGLSLT